MLEFYILIKRYCCGSLQVKGLQSYNLFKSGVWEKICYSATMHHVWAAWVRYPYNEIILKVWWTVTFQPFDLQRLTVSLQKDLKLLKTLPLFLDRLAPSKWPHLHRAFIGCLIFIFWNSKYFIHWYSNSEQTAQAPNLLYLWCSTGNDGLVQRLKNLRFWRNLNSIAVMVKWENGTISIDHHCMIT